MYLFIYEGFSGGRARQQKTEELVKCAVRKYAAETGLDLDGVSLEICRTGKGKPYFRELQIEFSVSHTDDLWVCLISDGTAPVGVDIQAVKETRQERIAERYFTDDEKRYLNTDAENAFFDIWTRKEAYAKYTGNGITKELLTVSTISNKELFFMDLDIRAGVKGACCTNRKGDLCIRMI